MSSPRAGAVALGLGVPLLAVALLALNGSLAFDASLGLPDPGTVTRLGLPAAKGLRDISAALTLGSLVLLAVAFPARERARSLDVVGPRRLALRWARGAASVWLLTSVAVIVLSFSDLAAAPITSPQVRSRIVYFATDFELGRLLLYSLLLVLVVAVGTFWATSLATVGILVVVTLAALWPLALGGHAAGTLNHELGVNTLYVHLVAVSVWVGGLALLARMRHELGESFAVVARRFSGLAGVCFVAVLVSGVVSALLRIPDLSGLATSYGALVLLKTLALGLLGLIGWQYRRHLLDELQRGRDGVFARLVVLELAVMALAMGAAVALSRTAPPPTVLDPLTTAESLLGHEPPPALTPARWLTYWEPDSFWLPVSVLGAALYLGGVLRLRRRGDRWPVGRTVAWLVGLAMLVWATSGSPGAYAEVLFSMHMVQHMTIATGAPIFLTLGAPVTLALRALRRRRDGSMGPREWVLLVVHSRVATILGTPAVAAALFIVSLVAFYYSDLFEMSMRYHTMHLLMVAHFLISGYLFANGMVGIDPGPTRPAYPFRMLIVMVTFGMHSFFSVSLMSSSRILAESWFTSVAQDWSPPLLEDQYLGASLGWALGDYPLAVLAAALVFSWVRADRREAARHDRREARENDATLNSYNEHLRRLQGRAEQPDRTSS